MRFRSFRSATFAGVVSVLSLNACFDATIPSAPSAQLAPDAPRTSSAGSGQILTAVSNAIRYRDSGLKPATGRSGSATLLARALGNKDGSTDLEVTTGASLDGAPAAPGNLNKVQVKAFSPAGTNPLFTQNYNGLTSGGRAAYHYVGIGRGARMEVQSNIGGIDPHRTDVVTVTEVVKARPDLAVSNVAAPGKAYRGAPVMISATVRELNADVGATDDCVLYADGVEIDRINNQWVDANGTVRCIFNHAFTSIGTKALEVRSQNVVPGDWDLANNSAAGTVTIVNPPTLLRGEINVRQYSGESQFADNNFNAISTSTSAIPFYTKSVYSTDDEYVNGRFPNPSEIPTSATVTLATGGWVRTSASMPLEPAYYNMPNAIPNFPTYAYDCFFNQDAAGFYAYYCGQGGGSFQAGHSSVQASYLSLFYNAFYNAASDRYIYTATPSQMNSGAPLPGALGSDLTIDATFTSLTHTYSAHAVTTLTPYTTDYNTPYSCYGDYFHHYCHGATRHETGVQGFSFF